MFDELEKSLMKTNHVESHLCLGHSLLCLEPSNNESHLGFRPNRPFLIDAPNRLREQEPP